MKKMKSCIKVRRRVSILVSLIVVSIATLIPAYADGYSIGGKGPAGGIVYYLDESGGGLEAAPVDQRIAEWSCYGTTISGAGETAVGTGQQNTAAILASECSSESAAEVASNYMGPDGTTGGWFLPSKDELNQLYLNNSVVGGFVDEFYWSSSESGNFNAWYQYFFDGLQNNYYLKYNSFRVRAVRAF